MDLELLKLIGFFYLYFFFYFSLPGGQRKCAFMKNLKPTVTVFGAAEERVCSLHTRRTGRVIPNQQSEAR